MAERVAELGFDGVDLTVRAGGHVKPEFAARDLPRAVKALKGQGIAVPMMTSDITSADETARATLETAAEHGIQFYRLGYYQYSKDKSLDDSLSEVHRELDALARLNERIGICGDYQNHAGEGYFGASLWDLWFATREIDPRWIGSQFDLRHASVEGAMAWPIDLRRVEDRVHTVVAKDFRWDGKGGVANCPLGTGVADFPRFFDLVGRTGAPVTVHLEYPLGGANDGAREITVPADTVLDAMRRDLGTVRRWLAR
jgi:sugar phosphate isomerase/epimerase